MIAAPLQSSVNPGGDPLGGHRALQHGLAPTADSPPDPEPLPIKVIRSARRTKSSAAKVVDGVIEVRIPEWMTETDEAEAVAELVARIERARRVQQASIDLDDRAFELGLKYDLPRPASIRWVNNQNRRWGSCSIQARTIRVSSRLATVPGYVLDYVILHELTHLVEANHNRAFHDLMTRYDHLERAEGFLDAMSFGCADDQYLSP